MHWEQYINGEFVAGEGAADPIFDPTTGAEIGKLASASEQQIDGAVRAARSAYQGWRQQTPGERAKLLLDIALRIEQAFDRLARTEALITGKPLKRILEDEKSTVVDPFRFFAGAIRCQQSAGSGEYVTGYQSWVRREPVGVAALIIPWNYPLMMACWKIAPAIAAGNAVIVKPSEQTSHSMLELMELIGDLLPDGLINVVTGQGREVGSKLSSHPGIDLVSLTGSMTAGTSVATQAAETIKKVLLELGGKAPVLIFPDADISKAAKTACAAGFYNAGQDCTAACRILVHEAAAEEFTNTYLNEVRKLTTGDAGDSDQSYGALISSAHLERVQKFVQMGLSDENVQTLLHTSTKSEGGGYYMPPTVFGNVPWQHALAQEEIFGPVTTITTFKDADPVAQWCNATVYGLAASVWTSDMPRALRISEQLEYGCVWINTHLMWPTEMPHGGFKQSGYGKEMSIYGLEDYQNIKHVMAEMGPHGA